MPFKISPGLAYSIKECHPGRMNKEDRPHGIIHHPVTILPEHVAGMYYVGIESLIPWKRNGTLIYFKERATGRIYAQERSQCGQER